jgi:hypothetical protein
LKGKEVEVGDVVLRLVLWAFMFGSSSPQNGEKIIIDELIFSESAALVRMKTASHAI